jgi:hypothetical protein
MNGTFRSRGIRHHADVRVTCPDCDRTFEHPHHTAVAELPGEVLSIQFKSKQDGRWGVLQIPVEEVCWGETRSEAYDCLKSRG